jgi:RNA-binding protein YhbY
VEFIDALSGELIAVIEKKIENKNVNEICKEIVTQIADEQIKSEGKTLIFRKLAPFNYKPLNIEGFYTVQDYAFYLRAYSQDPTNKTKLLQHYESHRERRIHNTPLGAQKPYLQTLLYKLMDLVDRDDPDAPNWLSLALWRIHFDPYIEAVEEESFAPLLNNYPNSFAALCVRYALAHNEIAKGNHEKAAPIFLEMAEAIEKGSADSFRWRSSDIRVSGSVYFFTAKAMQEAGNIELAKKYARKAFEVVGNGTILPAQPIVTGDVSGDSVGFKLSYVLRDVIEDGKVVLKAGKSFHEHIQALYYELHGMGDPTKPGERFIPLGDLYSAFKQHEDKKAFDYGWKYIEAYIQRQGEHRGTSGWADYYRASDFVLPWLYQQAPGRKQSEVVNLGRRLISALEKRKNMNAFKPFYSVLYAVGLYDEILNLVQEKLNLNDYDARYTAILQGAKVYNTKGMGDEEGLFLEKEIFNYDRDFRRTDEGELLLKIDEQVEYNFIDLIYKCAIVYRDRGKLNKAEQILKYGVKQDLFPGNTNNDLIREHNASLKYHLACIEEKMGNKKVALDLLKDVIKLSGSNVNYKIYYYTHSKSFQGISIYSYSSSPRVNNQGLVIREMYPAALEHIEQLRNSAQ